MRALVCGGRHFRSWGEVWRALNKLHKKYPITCLISGGCTGADTFAAEWADQTSIPKQIYKADWAIGPEAGPLRNQQMLVDGKPDIVVAFKGGRGTADMMRRAQNAGVRVWQPDLPREVDP